MASEAAYKQRKMDQESIALLLQRNDLWQASQRLDSSDAGYRTGFKELDAQLPHHGWPRVGICEVFSQGFAQGELSLVFALLRQLCPIAQHQVDAAESDLVLLVNPPLVPYVPTLVQEGVDATKLLCVQTQSRKEQLWSLEQALSSGSCPLVLAWLEHLTTSEVRRLQLASEKGQSLAIIYLPTAQVSEPHPVALKLALGIYDAQTKHQAPRSQGVAEIKPSGSGLDYNPTSANHAPSPVSNHKLSREYMASGANKCVISDVSARESQVNLRRRAKVGVDSLTRLARRYASANDELQQLGRQKVSLLKRRGAWSQDSIELELLPKQVAMGLSLLAQKADKLARYSPPFQDVQHTQVLLSSYSSNWDMTSESEQALIASQIAKLANDTKPQRAAGLQGG